VVEEIIDATVAEIYESLKQRESVSLRNFVLSTSGLSGIVAFSSSIPHSDYASCWVGHRLTKENCKWNSSQNEKNEPSPYLNLKAE